MQQNGLGNPTKTDEDFQLAAIRAKGKEQHG
jgi:hypothetical protein